jgi:hypothetical protein
VYVGPQLTMLGYPYNRDPNTENPNIGIANTAPKHYSREDFPQHKPIRMLGWNLESSGRPLLLIMLFYCVSVIPPSTF